MWRNIARSLMLTAAVTCVMGGLQLPVRGAEIRDSAALFTEKTLETANAQLAELKKTHGKEVHIESFTTVPKGKGAEVEKMSKSDRAQFFDKWAREQAQGERAKGIFILICEHPGHVEIVADRQTREQGFGATERNEVRDKLIAGFSKKKYDKGLLDGVSALSHTVKAKLKTHDRAEAAPLSGQHHGGNGGARARGGMGWLGWAVVALVVFLGFRLLGALFRGLSGGGMGGGGGPGGGDGPGGGGGGKWRNAGSGLMTGMFGALAGNWLHHSDVR